MCTCNQKTVTLKSFVCISRGERWAWFYKRSGKKPNGRPTCAEKSNFGYRNSLPFSFCILFSGFVLLSRFCCSLLQCSSMGKKSGRSAAKNIQNAYPFGWETDTNTHTFEKKAWDTWESNGIFQFSHRMWTVFAVGFFLLRKPHISVGRICSYSFSSSSRMKSR